MKKVKKTYVMPNGTLRATKAAYINGWKNAALYLVESRYIPAGFELAAFDPGMAFTDKFGHGIDLSPALMQHMLRYMGDWHPSNRL
jgi:hypothetical protein